ncbi:ABC transporter permease [Jeotgalibacillus sp. S-D1]|uniref:ABC transporter permease n=1 Tax=Jeotgalibacillus sp. S-D1 TaxID=2552189 RepID=UPI001059DF34|nr:ABC transporter permease [Jeotgalibacillus sp. S-D1]TDL32743.1 ABC transporter permease [Jeotgalibacillus sp. S-D1]
MFKFFTKPSAFRAVSNEDQQVEANEETKVFFYDKEYDLNHEYRPVRSVYSPKKDGIYLITGTISFEPESFDQNYRARVGININETPYEAGDNDFWGTGVEIANAVQVAAILKLAAGDEVEILMQSSVPGTIKANLPSNNTTNFSAARLIEL